jgi:hypothetical protein
MLGCFGIQILRENQLAGMFNQVSLNRTDFSHKNQSMLSVMEPI